MDKASFFILNVILNSFLAFFTVVFLIEMFIILFRIPHGRIAANLRMLPILKLPLDLFLYDFSRWAYAQGINPLDCEKGTRTLSLMFGYIHSFSEWLLPAFSSIQLLLPGDMTFTVADVIGYTIHPLLLKILVPLFLLITVVFINKKLFSYYQARQTLRLLAKQSQQIPKKLLNSPLSSFLKKRNVQIMTSPIIRGSPFIAGLFAPIVYVPANLYHHLSQKEYEAVLAHEIEHIRHRDSLVRLILECIESIFWWIPTKWLHHRITEGQEIGCDSQYEKYGVNSLDLASAICKSAKGSIKPPDLVLTHYLTKHSTFKRVNMLLNPPTRRFNRIGFAFHCLTMVTAFLFVFLGRFWLF